MQLAQRQRDGRPLRDHLLAAQRNGNYTHPLLVAEPLPHGGELLWQALTELSAARPQGMSSAGAVPFSEIEAWQRLNGVRFTPWELETLLAMDTVLRSQADAQRESARAQARTKPNQDDDE